MNRNDLEPLYQEIKRLQTIIRNADKELRKAPPGGIQVKPHKNGVQYYHRREGERNAVYLPVRKQELAHALIQKHYLEKLRLCANEQLSQLTKFVKKYDPDGLKKVFLSESPARQKVIRAVDWPNDLFASMWQAEEYEHKPFAEGLMEHYTEKGERVRSKSEAMIANTLYHAGIPYKYECPLIVNGKLIHPDITLLRTYDQQVIYWEHQGLMDDYDYRNHAFSRVRDYEADGIFVGKQLIITFETNRMPLNQIFIDSKLREFHLI